MEPPKEAMPANEPSGPGAQQNCLRRVCPHCGTFSNSALQQPGASGARSAGTSKRSFMTICLQDVC